MTKKYFFFYSKFLDVCWKDYYVMVLDFSPGPTTYKFHICVHIIIIWFLISICFQRKENINIYLIF